MFFKKLFDVKFESFITRDVAKILYSIMLGLVLLGLALAELAGFIAFFQGEYMLQGLLFILISPLAALLFLIIIRVAFESSIALISIAENTKK
jgi:hypothetical protein